MNLALLKPTSRLFFFPNKVGIGYTNHNVLNLKLFTIYHHSDEQIPANGKFDVDSYLKSKFYHSLDELEDKISCILRTPFDPDFKPRSWKSSRIMLSNNYGMLFKIYEERLPEIKLVVGYSLTKLNNYAYKYANFVDRMKPFGNVDKLVDNFVKINALDILKNIKVDLNNVVVLCIKQLCIKHVKEIPIKTPKISANQDLLNAKKELYLIDYFSIDSSFFIAFYPLHPDSDYFYFIFLPVEIPEKATELFYKDLNKILKTIEKDGNKNI